MPENSAAFRGDAHPYRRTAPVPKAPPVAALGVARRACVSSLADCDAARAAGELQIRSHGIDLRTDPVVDWRSGKVKTASAGATFGRVIEAVIFEPGGVEVAYGLTSSSAGNTVTAAHLKHIWELPGRRLIELVRWW